MSSFFIKSMRLIADNSTLTDIESPKMDVDSDFEVCAQKVRIYKTLFHTLVSFTTFMIYISHSVSVVKLARIAVDQFLWAMEFQNLLCKI